MNKRMQIGSALVAVAGLLFGGVAFAADSTTAAMNMFGGPVYSGEPALQVTAALVDAGGGAANFSFQKALVSMLGEKTVNAEVAKLTKQYGAKNVNDFIAGMDFAVEDSLKHATAAGIKLPAAPADLKGQKLAKTLVSAGTVDGTFWSGWLFDNALSHTIHVQVMVDINAKHSFEYDQNTHRLLNQAMYDVGHALGDTQVKLASLH
ncbi:MAG: hypothetical protein ACREPN_04625 [Rudaea sp.]